MQPSSILIILLALFLFIVAFVLIKTLLFARKSSSLIIPFEYNIPRLKQNPQTLAEHLSSVVQIPWFL